MAIESVYWREELSRISRLLKPSKFPKRWSERQSCTIERDVMIGFFIVRRLIELDRVGVDAKDLMLSVFRNTPIKNITFLNKFELHENYDWDKIIEEKASVTLVANQFIHAVMSVLVRGEDRNWTEFYVFSDYEQKKSIFRINVSQIRSAFLTVSKSWPSGTKVMTYNSRRADYDFN
jgi:hypothetical protein